MSFQAKSCVFFQKPTLSDLPCSLLLCTWHGSGISVGDSKATFHTESALFITPSRCPPSPRNDCNASNLTLMLSLPLAPRIPTRPWRISTTPISCLLNSAGHTVPWTVPLISSTGVLHFPRIVSGLNTCLACTKK